MLSFHRPDTDAEVNARGGGEPEREGRETTFACAAARRHAAWRPSATVRDDLAVNALSWAGEHGASSVKVGLLAAVVSPTTSESHGQTVVFATAARASCVSLMLMMLAGPIVRNRSLGVSVRVV